VSDDLSGQYLTTRGVEDEDAAADARMKAAREEDSRTEFMERLKALPSDAKQNLDQFRDWVGKLPVNSLGAAYDAVKNTADSLLLFGHEYAKSASTRALGAPHSEQSQMDRRDQRTNTATFARSPEPKLEDIAPEFMGEAQKLRDQISLYAPERSDVITQKALQFAIPFMGTLRAMGVTAQTPKAAKVMGAVAADAVTSWNVWAPDEGRFADLLREVAPNESMVPAFVDFLASDPTDTQADARLKNVLDSGLVGAGLAGFLKASAATMRAAKGGSLAAKAGVAAAGAAAPAATAKDKGK